MAAELEYSEYGLKNRYLFLHNNVDICVFIEDKNKEYMYEIFFENLFQNVDITFCFFAQGGKSGVKNAYHDYGDSSDHSINVYLVDGDFDLILNKDIIASDHFIYLKRYNIESYLINEKGIVKYVSHLIKKTQNEVKSIIKIDDWMNTNYCILQKLFFNFIVSQQILPSEKQFP